jgi:two-component system sensor histidine kinase DctS
MLIGGSGAAWFGQVGEAPFRADGRQTGWMGSVLDITERKQARERSRQQEEKLAATARLVTMGEMASALAHELNQPLAAIVAYVDACQELVESRRMGTEQLVGVLRAVSSQAERAGQIIHRLRKMVKRSQPVRTPMSVNDAVREVAVLIEAEARQSGVTVREELAENLPESAADFLQIQNVLLHLMRNGIDAMFDTPADQCDLTVSTHLAAAGDIEVAICDRGSGLTGDSAERLFEPFFTTRSSGLGLGLSISRMIVDAHGGRLWITPNSSRGVTARFTLPASGGKVPDEPQADRLYR